MAIAIDRQVAGDINNPSFDVINYCIKEHAKEVPRLQMLFDYYEGTPHKINKTADKTPHELDEVYVNNAKYVTDMMTGFMLGNPISYSASETTKDDIQPIVDALKKMRINKHDVELEKDLSSMGIGYELHYLAVSINSATEKAEAIPKVASIDPRGMILVVDDTVERTPLFAIRPREKRELDGSKYWEISVYTPKYTIVYKSDNNQLVSGQLRDKIDVKEHYYGDVPVVEFRNNEEKQGDYEQQLSQIDGYNQLQTDRINDKKNFVKALMILYGFSLPEKEPAEVNGAMVINAPAKKEGANAEFVSNTFQESEVQVLADSLLDDFHKTTYIPNLNDENFAGTQSGEAMKFKLLGLLLALSVKTGYFEDGVIRRLKLIENILNTKGNHVNTDDIEIKFKVNLPFNRRDIIDQIRDSQEFIPLLVSLGWLDDVDNPQAVINLLNEQKEESIKMNQKVMGLQAGDSHNDLEDESEQEEPDKKKEKGKEDAKRSEI